LRQRLSKREGLSVAPLLVLFVLALLAFSTRILPVAVSDLPFNNDGMTEARIASDILTSGSLDFPEGSYYLDTHSIITPVYDCLLAFVSASVGSSPYTVAQYVVACVAVTTIAGIYAVALLMTKSPKGALMAAMVLSLSGTFVFLTGSAWKASLGVALLVLLAYAHMNRSDRRMLLLEATLLFTLVFVHHLVAILAYLVVAYATGVSVTNSVLGRRLSSANKRDIILVSVVSACAFVYYGIASLDRFTTLISENGLLIMIMVFMAILAVSIILVRQKGHYKVTFAPIPALVVMSIFAWEYYSPIFPYSGGYPAYVLLLGVTTSILLGIAWYGIETALMSKSVFRTLPMVWLLPVVTILLYAVVGGATLASHQIIYRSFDFAYISLAMGISFTVAVATSRPLREILSVILVLSLLLISFPFGYMTDTLEGIRHDSQEYEIDALTWVYVNEGPDSIIQSDERISYNGRALYDFVKRPHVPDYLMEQRLPSDISLNLYLEEWAVDGLNHYPSGYIVLDLDVATWALDASSVLYVGGPAEDNIIIFRSSEAGQSVLVIP